MINKTVRIGSLEGYSIFCHIELKIKNVKADTPTLSISGVHGPKRNGNAYGGCGQLVMEFKEIDKRGYYSLSDIKPAPAWTHEKIEKFFQIWDNWHLNDMRPYCEHQKSWDTQKELILTDYTWSTKYHHLREQAAKGKLSPSEYAAFTKTAAKVEMIVFTQNSPKYETPIVKDLLSEGYLEGKKHETKTAGLVHPEEHPEGLLTKPCPVCGYKYGTEWKKEPLPTYVITFLAQLPQTDIIPAWV